MFLHVQNQLDDTAKGLREDKERLEEHVKEVEEAAAAEKVSLHVHACLHAFKL